MTKTVQAAETTYRITNWSQYSESLVRRGDVTFWFDERVLKAWHHQNLGRKMGRRSSTPIWRSSRWMLRELFRLPYRQTEGLGRALMKLLEADVAVPTSRRWPNGPASRTSPP